MYVYDILVLQLVLLLFALYTQAERVMRPKFKEVKIWSDNYYVKNDVVFDESEPHMNITINVLRELHDVDIQIVNSVLHKDNVNHFMNFNSSFSLCSMLSWRDQSPIGNIVHSYLREYGKVVETCPIAKGKYYLHKFWIPEDPITAKLPEVDFDIHITSYHVDEQKQRTLIIDNHITGEAVVQDVSNMKRGNIMSMMPMGG